MFGAEADNVRRGDVREVPLVRVHGLLFLGNFDFLGSDLAPLVCGGMRGGEPTAPPSPREIPMLRHTAFAAALLTATTTSVAAAAPTCTEALGSLSAAQIYSQAVLVNAVKKQPTDISGAINVRVKSAMAYTLLLNGETESAWYAAIDATLAADTLSNSSAFAPAVKLLAADAAETITGCTVTELASVQVALEIQASGELEAVPIGDYEQLEAVADYELEAVPLVSGETLEAEATEDLVAWALSVDGDELEAVVEDELDAVSLEDDAGQVEGMLDYVEGAATGSVAEQLAWIAALIELMQGD